MENSQERKNGNGLINPKKNDSQTLKVQKKIFIKNDGLMEREENKVITDDGRELLKEN